jgi:hypothetical protein
LSSGEIIDNFIERGDADNVNIWNHGSFFFVFFRKKYPLKSELSSENRRRKGSRNRTNQPIEREFPKYQGLSKQSFIKEYFFPKDSEGNREVVNGSFFLGVGWSEVHGDS